MKLILPTSDLAMIDLIQNCAQGLQVAGPKLGPLTTQFATPLAAQLNSYRNQYHALLSARSAHATQRHAVRAQERHLRQRLRDAFQLVRRQKRNPEFPSSLFIAFGLRSDGGQTPLSHRLNAPIQIARRLIAADQAAQEQQFNILTDPSPAELHQLAVALDRGKSLLAELENTEKAQFETMKQVRQRSQQLLLELRISMRLATLGQPQQASQQLLRELGFQFRSSSTPPLVTPQSQPLSSQASVPECSHVPADPASAKPQATQADAPQRPLETEAQPDETTAEQPSDRSQTLASPPPDRPSVSSDVQRQAAPSPFTGGQQNPYGRRRRATRIRFRYTGRHARRAIFGKLTKRDQRSEGRCLVS